MFTKKLYRFCRGRQHDRPQTDSDNFSTRNKRTGSKVKIKSQNTEPRRNSLYEARISHRIFPKWKHFKNDHWIVQCLVILLLFFVCLFFCFVLSSRSLNWLLTFLGYWHIIFSFLFLLLIIFFSILFSMTVSNQIGFCFLLTHWTIVSHHIWMVCSFNWREKKRIQNEPSIAAIVAIGYGVRKNCFVWAVNRINGHARDSLVIP